MRKVHVTDTHFMKYRGSTRACNIIQFIILIRHATYLYVTNKTHFHYSYHAIANVKSLVLEQGGLSLDFVMSAHICHGWPLSLWTLDLSILGSNPMCDTVLRSFSFLFGI